MRLQSLRSKLTGDDLRVVRSNDTIVPPNTSARESEILSAMPRGVQMTDREVCYALQQSDMNYVRPHITRMLANGLLQEGPRRRCIVTGVLVRTTVNNGEQA